MHLKERMKLKYKMQLKERMKLKYQLELREWMQKKYKFQLKEQMQMKYKLQLKEVLQMKYKSQLAFKLRRRYKDHLRMRLKQKHTEVLESQLKENYRAYLRVQLKEKYKTTLRSPLAEKYRNMPKRGIQVKQLKAIKSHVLQNGNTFEKEQSILREFEQLMPTFASQLCFRSQMIPGLIFVCSSYERVLFEECVREWKNYDDDILLPEQKLYSSNPEKTLHVCWACSKSLRNGKMPAMSVRNKLERICLQHSKELRENN